MRLRIIVPVLHCAALVDKALSEYRRAASPETELSVAALANGTRTIESDFDVALAAPETVRLVQLAAEDGVDACTIACFSDPGLAAAREAVPIPVIGEGAAALATAGLVGTRFCVVTTWRQCLPRIRRLVAAHGMTHRLAEVCAVDRGVMDLDYSALEDIVARSAVAVREQGADVVVMACTGTTDHLARAVETRLREELHFHVPVIDPVEAAVALAESCAAHRVRHSEAAYSRAVSPRSEYRFASGRAEQTGG